jgi:hypothetical protein
MEGGGEEEEEEEEEQEEEEEEQEEDGTSCATSAHNPRHQQCISVQSNAVCSS